MNKTNATANGNTPGNSTQGLGVAMNKTSQTVSFERCPVQIVLYLCCNE